MTLAGAETQTRHGFLEEIIMANSQDDISGYDLGSTGTILKLQTAGGCQCGWLIEGTAAADYVVEVRGNDVDWIEIDSYSSATSVDDGKIAPEALQIRIRNTSTAAGETADVMLGVDN